MSIKSIPSDFRVEEIPSVQTRTEGQFGFYRLQKSGWTTPDAVAAIRRRWQLDLRRLSYGGLKDRHAETIQYLTIFRGPRRNLTHHGIRLEYLGQIERPYGSSDIEANRFDIVVRGLSEAEVEHARIAAAEVVQFGVPNYFDDQRFGSVASEEGFLARHLLHGKFEDALRQALAAPYEFDRAPAKKEKAPLKRHWGDWTTLKEHLPRGHARSLICYLADHPADFRGAIARLRRAARALPIRVPELSLEPDARPLAAEAPAAGAACRRAPQAGGRADAAHAH